MKKVLAYLVAVILTCACCAMADSATDEMNEITFQDILWGSSVETVAEWVIQREEYSLSYDTAEKLLGWYMPWNKGSSWRSIILTGDGATLDPQVESSYEKALANWSTFGGESGELAGFEIAGYKLNELYYDFTYDGEKTGLISVGVSLECPNGTDAAFADLQQKLRVVYGAGDIDDENTYFKTGAGNTAVLLRRNDEPILVYGVTNATELLDAAVRPTPTVNPSDTSGL